MRKKTIQLLDEHIESLRQVYEDLVKESDYEQAFTASELYMEGLRLRRFAYEVDKSEVKAAVGATASDGDFPLGDILTDLQNRLIALEKSSDAVPSS